MTRLTSRLRLGLALLLVTVLALTGSVIWSWPLTETRVIFCDVGQGDAILIIQGFTQVLIDSGPKPESVKRCLSRFLPWWERTIELVVITHADADHIGGFPALFASYQMRNTLIDLVGKPSRDFLDLRRTLLKEQDQGGEVWQPILGQIISLTEQVTLTVISPQVAGGDIQLLNPDLTETVLSDILTSQEADIESYNDGSIVLLVTIGEITLLLTGDLEEAGEQALLSRALITDVDLLKVGHHGSKTSTSPGFLAQVRPEIAIISAGQNNRYGHPADSVIHRLEEAGAQILRTDQRGDIELISNGRTYWFTE